MQAIIEKLKNGNAVEKLAVISDVISILGVSVATFITAPIIQNAIGFNTMMNYVVFGIFVLFYTIVFVFILGAFYKHAAPGISTKVQFGSIINFLIYVIFLLIAIGGICFCAYLVKQGIR